MNLRVEAIDDHHVSLTPQGVQQVVHPSGLMSQGLTSVTKSYAESHYAFVTNCTRLKVEHLSRTSRDRLNFGTHKMITMLRGAVIPA